MFVNAPIETIIDFFFFKTEFWSTGVPQITAILSATVQNYGGSEWIVTYARSPKLWPLQCPHRHVIKILALGYWPTLRDASTSSPAYLPISAILAGTLPWFLPPALYCSNWLLTSSCCCCWPSMPNLDLHKATVGCACPLLQPKGDRDVEEIGNRESWRDDGPLFWKNQGSGLGGIKQEWLSLAWVLG